MAFLDFQQEQLDALQREKDCDSTNSQSEPERETSPSTPTDQGETSTPITSNPDDDNAGTNTDNPHEPPQKSQQEHPKLPIQMTTHTHPIFSAAPSSEPSVATWSRNPSAGKLQLLCFSDFHLFTLNCDFHLKGASRYLSATSIPFSLFLDSSGT